MKYSKRISSFIICILLSAGVLSACANGSDISSSISQAAESTFIPDTSDAVTITLSDGSAEVSGNGANCDNGVVTITSGGTYVVSGKLSDGRIIVNAPHEEVTVLLDNADISCSYGSPIYIYKSQLTNVYLAEGTTNILTDGSEYTFSDSFSSAVDEEPNACLYSCSDLVIAGSGMLTVNANYNNGITSKDTLKIETSSVNVTAKNNGINGKDFCVINNADIIVESGGDALRSTNDSDSALGYIVVTNSSLELTAGEDGIQAETALTINGGSCNVTSGVGGGNASSDTSAKGLKGGTGVTLNGGEYTLDCSDDAIHSNGNVLISGGTYQISAGDDGIHADENTAVTDGVINIIKSYEGIEGAAVDISGGTINITASDDGINAAGGADQSGFGPRLDKFANSSDCCINISGGTITIDASGDGIDSNGNITVSGGEIYVSGPTNNGNGALDYGGTATITGGIVVAAGASGMAQNFGSNSTQGSIMLTYPAASTETVTLKDADGNMLVGYTPAKSYNCVVISCPSVTTGKTYTVEACGQTSSVTMDNLIYGNSDGMGGGRFGGGFGGKHPDAPDMPGEFNGEKRPDDMGAPRDRRKDY